MPVKSEDDVLGALALPLGKVSDVKWLRMCREVVASPWFEGLIQFCIVCSSAALMFDMPNIPPDGELKHILHNLDVTFTTIFVAEMSLKLYAFGAFVFLMDTSDPHGTSSMRPSSPPPYYRSR